MAAYAVVEHLDVIEDVSPGEFSRLVNPFLDALGLKAAEERFRHSVAAPMSRDECRLL